MSVIVPDIHSSPHYNCTNCCTVVCCVQRVRFADNSDGFPGSPVEATLLAPPPVETSEASTSTSDPLYDK